MKRVTQAIKEAVQSTLTISSSLPAFYEPDQKPFDTCVNTVEFSTDELLLPLRKFRHAL